MRGEDEHALGEGGGGYGTCGVVGIGLATGPSGDGVLQVVEDLDVYLVIGLAQTIEHL